MQNVLLRDTDQMSMAHALEVRVPFLDHRLVEYILGIDDFTKKPYSSKRLLVDSLDNLLPEVIVYRKKMGFVFPIAEWMRNELKTMCDKSILSLAEKDIFDRKVLVDLWSNFLNGQTASYWYVLWSLVILENWLNENGVE